MASTETNVNSFDLRDAAANFGLELKHAIRSLARARGLAITVILTLALGIGANTAIFTVVRGVLLRPLVNRDESSLIYLRQSAPGLNVENAVFSVPEVLDLRQRLKSVSSLSEFSSIGFTLGFRPDRLRLAGPARGPRRRHSGAAGGLSRERGSARLRNFASLPARPGRLFAFSDRVGLELNSYP